MEQTTAIQDREKLQLSGDQARDILYEENDDFEIIQDKILETTRWSILNLLVIKRLSDGKFFSDGYRVGATEQQDEMAWEHDTPNFVEVFEKEKVVKVYE